MATGALIGALRVTLGLDSAAFETGMGLAQKRVTGFTKSFAAAGASIQRAGLGLTAAITAPFVALVAKSIPAAKESAQAIAQVNAALKSMGPVAGRTSDQLSAFAGHLQDISNFDDDDILKSVTANMLTFGNVAGEQFDRATLAAVNLSARLGQDLQSSAIQVGKALNDPVKGITALQRVGIQFTQAQKDQIKAMVDVGNVAGAQKLILAELEKEFGGAAKAQRDATPGADAAQAWRTFQEVLGGIALKVLPPLTAQLAKLLNAFTALSPATQNVVVGVAAFAAVIGPLTTGIGTIIRLGAPFLAAMAGMGLELMGVATAEAAAASGSYALGVALGAALVPALPIIAAVAGAAALAYAAWQHWDEIKPILSGLWDTIKSVFGPPLMAVLDGVKTTLSELWQGPFGDLMRAAGALAVEVFGELRTLLGALWEAIKPAVVAFGEFALALGKALGSETKAVLLAIGQIIATTFRQIGDVINVIAALLQGHWGEAWSYAKKVVSDGITGALKIIETLAPGALAAMRGVYEGVKTWLQDRVGAVFDWLKGKLKDAGDWFYNLYDRVVGHSYIPDMVQGIAEHIARLDGVMVKPIEAAAKKAGDAFEPLRDRLKTLLDQLYPDQAQMHALEASLADLDAALANKIGDPEVWRAARERVIAQMAQLERDVAAKSAANDNLPDIQVDIDKLDAFARQASEDALRHKKANDQIIASYAGMASSVLGSIRNIVDAVKNGDFLDVLQSIADTIVQIFGKDSNGTSIASTIGGLFGGGKAVGGPVSSGTTYLVGEKGPELFTPSTGGTIIPNDKLRGAANDRGGRPVYFDLRNAVMTSDLVEQMQYIANDTSGRVVADNNRRQGNIRRRTLG